MKRMSNVDECGVTTWSMREATILTCPGKCVQRPVSVSDAVMSQLPGSGGTNQKRRKFTIEGEDQSPQP